MQSVRLSSKRGCQVDGYYSHELHELFDRSAFASWFHVTVFHILHSLLSCIKNDRQSVLKAMFTFSHLSLTVGHHLKFWWRWMKNRWTHLSVGNLQFSKTVLFFFWQSVLTKTENSTRSCFIYTRNVLSPRNRNFGNHYWHHRKTHSRFCCGLMQ